MSGSFERVRQLVPEGNGRVSEHATDALDDDGILPTDVVNGVQLAELLEDYPDFPK